MNAAKEIFLRPSTDGKQSLAQWWQSIVNDERFPVVAMTAQASLFMDSITEAEMQGARRMLQTMTDLPVRESSMATMPASGIKHRIPELTRPQPDSH